MTAAHHEQWRLFTCLECGGEPDRFFEASMDLDLWCYCNGCLLTGGPTEEDEDFVEVPYHEAVVRIVMEL